MEKPKAEGAAELSALDSADPDAGSSSEAAALPAQKRAKLWRGTRPAEKNMKETPQLGELRGPAPPRLRRSPLAHLLCV